MAQHKIEWLENKSPEWKVVSLDSGAKDVSINKVGKHGETWPDWEAITVGATVEGDFWTSPAGKNYLFPPKVAKVNGVAYNSKPNIGKMMEKKAEYIEQAQERKSDSIAYFNAINSAIALANFLRPNGESETKLFIQSWRDWFLAEWEKHNQKPPF